MILRIVRMTFDPEQTSDFLDLFAEVSESIRRTAGCRSVSLIADPKYPNVMGTISYWDDEASLEAYRSSDFFKNTWKRTKKMFAAPPEARSYFFPLKDSN